MSNTEQAKPKLEPEVKAKPPQIPSVIDEENPEFAFRINIKPDGYTLTEGHFITEERVINGKTRKFKKPTSPGIRGRGTDRAEYRWRAPRGQLKIHLRKLCLRPRKQPCLSLSPQVCRARGRTRHMHIPVHLWQIGAGQDPSAARHQKRARRKVARDQGEVRQLASVPR